MRECRSEDAPRGNAVGQSDSEDAPHGRAVGGPDSQEAPFGGGTLRSFHGNDRF